MQSKFILLRLILSVWLYDWLVSNASLIFSLPAKYYFLLLKDGLLR